MTWYDWLSTAMSAWFLAAIGTGVLLGQLIQRAVGDYPKAVPGRAMTRTPRR